MYFNKKYPPEATDKTYRWIHLPGNDMHWFEVLTPEVNNQSAYLDLDLLIYNCRKQSNPFTNQRTQSRTTQIFSVLAVGPNVEGDNLIKKIRKIFDRTWSLIVDY